MTRRVKLNEPWDPRGAAFMKLLLTLVLLFLCGCGPSVISTDSMPSPSPSQTEQIREAITNVARAYFKAGVESALLSQALTPGLKGDAATTAAYGCVKYDHVADQIETKDRIQYRGC